MRHVSPSLCRLNDSFSLPVIFFFLSPHVWVGFACGDWVLSNKKSSFSKRSVKRVAVRGASTLKAKLKFEDHFMFRLFP